jgi:hypothetical protein
VAIVDADKSSRRSRRVAPARASQPPSPPKRRESAKARDSRRPEGGAGASASQIAQLQAQISRLRQEKGQLEERLAKSRTENQALAGAATDLSRRVELWRKVANQTRHGEFWTLYQRFAAVCDEAEAYANAVNFDPTRIFATTLLSELREWGVDQALVAHAEKIVDLFDPFFYLTEHQDLTVAGDNPLLHYITVGFTEGRQPNPLFDPVFYRTQAGGVKGDPLLHFIEVGAKTDLNPHPLFDAQYYRERTPDIRASGTNPLFHYQLQGCREGRSPSLLFDSEYYLEQAGGVALLTGNPLHDYLLLGGDAPDPHPLFSNRYVQSQMESRPIAAPLVAYETNRALWQHVRPHPLFSLDYLPNVLGIDYPDDISPFAYYSQLLEQYDVDPGILFDSALYRYQVEQEQGQALHDAPILDYLKRGYKDKNLRPNVIFDPAAYLSRNQIEVSGPELVHYCFVGDRRGYYCHELFSAGLYNAVRTDDEPVTALEHFLLADEAVESHPHVARTLDRRAIDFVLNAIHSPDDFDAEFYKASYPDLAGLNDAEARDHYFLHGKSEGRWGSPRDIVETLRIAEVPLGFFSDEYLALNPDLQLDYKSDFFPLFMHYLTVGRIENRRIGRWQFHLDPLAIEIPTVSIPAPVQPVPEHTDVCVVMHFFYDDLWPELAGFANSFSEMSRDVYINVVDIAWSFRFQRELRELCPGAFVQLSNDNGRDIGGFVRLLDNIDIERYTAFAFMHSKKSPHIAPERGTHWRRTLLNAFAGNKQIATDAVELFRSDPSVGLIASKDWRATDLGNNLANYQRMLDYFEISEENREVEYVSGTMFLIRPEIIRRLYDGLKNMEFEYGGDKNVEFHRDGQIAHAVERVVGNLTRQMGYRIQWN